MACVMRPKIALIGTGNISEFHAPAIKAAGFDIIGCCGSPNSERAKKFSISHSIKRVYNNYNEVIDDSSNWDCLLIATSVETTYSILKKSLITKKPIMVEKPVSTKPEELLNLGNDLNKVMVAYNRRFYSTIQYAKIFLEKYHPCQIKLELPDSIDFNIDKQNQEYFSVRENSVHGFDLLFYLLPDLQLKIVDEYKQPNNAYGKYAILESPRGDSVFIYLNWNSPSNFSLNLESYPHRLELKPFETFSLYKGMQVIEPSEDYPLRKYVPKLIKSGNVFEKNKQFKPGFYEQSLEFLNIVKGQKPLISANINDAYRAAYLADLIIKK